MVDPLSRPPSSSIEDVVDLLVLDQLPRVGPVTVRRLVSAFGTAGRALRAPRAAFRRIAGPEATRVRGAADIRGRVETAMRRAEGAGMAVITWNDPTYPADLRNLSDPPPVLFLRGRLELLREPGAVAVVGARRATARGRDIAERLGAALGRAEVTTVSGLALGVDGAVHAGTLSVGGAAVAVLGSGADVPYPKAHSRLFERIAERGLLVSEFLPGTGAAPHHFPRRNRILAGLANTTVVVEAGRRSGSLITVDHALDLGRDIWSVPGPIDSSTCAGSNRLLADGARPLVSIADFVGVVAGSTFDAAPDGTPDPPDSRDPAASGRLRAPAPDAMANEPASSDSLEDRVLDALAHDTLAVDTIAELFGVPVGKTLAILTTLELHGEVVRVAGMRFRKAA